jgi:phage I-like protein
VKTPFTPVPVYLAQTIDLIALAAVATGGLPTEFRLFEAGRTKTTKGDILCDAVHASAVLTQLAQDGRDALPIDYDHDMVSPLGSNKKAAGWFKLAARGGELWATDVTWTPAAAKALSEREYRYFSPALFRDDKGFVTRIINVALTNLPATLNQPALVASEGTPMDPELLAAELAQLKTSHAALLAATATLQAPAWHAWAATQYMVSIQAFAAAAPVVAAVATVTTAKSPTADSGATILSEDEKKTCLLLSVSEEDFLATKKHLLASGNVWAFDPNAVKESK